jgi:hypothetical protein
LISFKVNRMYVKYIGGWTWEIDGVEYETSDGLSGIVNELIRRGASDPRLAVMGGFANVGVRFKPMVFSSKVKHGRLIQQANAIISGTMKGVPIGRS